MCTLYSLVEFGNKIKTWNKIPRKLYSTLYHMLYVDKISIGTLCCSNFFRIAIQRVLFSIWLTIINRSTSNNPAWRLFIWSQHILWYSLTLIWIGCSSYRLFVAKYVEHKFVGIFVFPRWKTKMCHVSALKYISHVSLLVFYRLMEFLKFICF